MGVPEFTYEESRLENGLRVLLQDTPSLTTAVLLRVSFGTMNERQGEEGMAHFLEHILMAGGSRKYSPAELKRIERGFGSRNASTGLTTTIFDGEVLPDRLDSYLDVLADKVFYPVMESDSFETQRGRILSEIANSRGGSGQRSWEELREVALGEGSPHLLCALGSEELVSRVSPGEMMEFYERGYGDVTKDLVIVGNLPKDIDERVEELFSDVPVGESRPIEIPETPRLREGIILHKAAPGLLYAENPEASDAAVDMFIQFPNDMNEGGYAAVVLSRVLAEGGHSRIYNAVSNRMGAAYSFDGSYMARDNLGVLTLAGSVNARRAHEAIDTIFGEFQRMQDEEISDEDLLAAKDALLFQSAKASQSPMSRAYTILGMVDGDESTQAFMDHISRVTPQDVQHVAKEWLPRSRGEGGYAILLRDPHLIP